MTNKKTVGHQKDPKPQEAAVNAYCTAGLIFTSTQSNRESMTSVHYREPCNKYYVHIYVENTMWMGTEPSLAEIDYSTPKYAISATFTNKDAWSFFYPGVPLSVHRALAPPSKPPWVGRSVHAEAGARSSSWDKVTREVLWLLDSDTRTRPEIVALALSVGRKVMRITSVSGALDGGLMGHALRQGRPPPVLYDSAFARCRFCARASEEADPTFFKEVVRSHGARLSYVIGPAGLSISCATSRMAIEEANKPLR
ncbi:hypothetical protein B0H13DRAFT_2465288 [Mycena leptocephala]|nr:hypothetical protein B0H13DRAFT_2465288 [Mycena leptocephala]